jgi:Ni,Fe-hydrogenase III large subunit
MTGRKDGGPGNGRSLPLAAVTALPWQRFRDAVCRPAADAALSALFCLPRETPGLLLCAVLADKARGSLDVKATVVEGTYPALTPDCPQAHLFEREIFETWGVRPEGHPWLKPVRFPPNGRRENSRIGSGDFFTVGGEEIHEVAVGPVHAGIIEPGHFRFQCHGETVYHLEISLGYQHRGIENALPGAAPSRRLRLIETVSGDASAGHAAAYCAALEALSGAEVSPRDQAVRGLALELERIACHIGDLGAMAGDIGFLPSAAFCGRIRGEVLNLTAAMCGNRFSRGLFRPGGIGPPPAEEIWPALRSRLQEIRRDARAAIELFFDTPSALARLEHTGVVPQEAARDIGLVGPAARACGLARDVRRDFPYGIYRSLQLPVALGAAGDVLARAAVRWLEIRHSFAFCEDILGSLPCYESGAGHDPGALQPDSMAVSLVEGWRGEICHIAVTDGEGRLSGYRVIDPSFHNWFGLALALRGGEISDFPLCNKSFNLSYCGFDL